MIDGILNRGDFFCHLIRDLYTKCLFHSHDQLYQVQGVGSQVIYEGSTRNYLILFNT